MQKWRLAVKSLSIHNFLGSETTNWWDAIRDEKRALSVLHTSMRWQVSLKVSPQIKRLYPESDFFFWVYSKHTHSLTKGISDLVFWCFIAQFGKCGACPKILLINFSVPEFVLFLWYYWLWLPRYPWKPFWCPRLYITSGCALRSRLLCHIIPTW